MRRRDFITLIGGAAAWRLGARAQQPAMPVIGSLHSASLDPWRRELVSAFHLGLKEVGCLEGLNVAIEYRWAENKINQLPALAEELAHRSVTAIAATNTPAALAAVAATKTIPIVFSTSGNPVELGLVSSFNRPGGNVTGVAFLGGELAAKQLQFLKELLPQTSRVAVLVNQAVPGLAKRSIDDAQSAGRGLGLEIVVLRASTPQELEAALRQVVNDRIGGLLVNADGFFISRREQLVALAASHRVPVVYAIRDFTASGGLMSYGSNVNDSWRLVGVYVGRIVKGETVADLPVLQPVKFEFVINLKTAKVLGLEVPDRLLALADEVIE